MLQKAVLILAVTAGYLLNVSLSSARADISKHMETFSYISRIFLVHMAYKSMTFIGG
jgi:hypothetical protein